MKNQILLVDDDHIFRSEFKAFFEEYHIIEAKDGNEALSLLEMNKGIDLVFLDIKIPGMMDGIEILKKIKQASIDVSIVIITGYSSKENILEILRLRADDYIEKPIDVDKARGIINRILQTKFQKINYDISTTEKKIEAIKAFIAINWFKKIQLKDIARMFCLSPKYLSRIFKQYTGRGFNEYILKIKLNKAKEMLLKTGYNIKQISHKLEYRNSESFIRQFKKYTDYTPTEYRKTRLIAKIEKGKCV